MSIWSTAYPNGITLSLDDKVLYVAQIFSNLKPIVPDDRIWAFKLNALVASEIARNQPVGVVLLGSSMDLTVKAALPQPKGRGE